MPAPRRVLTKAIPSSPGSMRSITAASYRFGFAAKVTTLKPNGCMELVGGFTQGSCRRSPMTNSEQRPRGLLSARVKAQNTSKVVAKVAAVKPYKIVFVLKGAGKSVLPLRRRLRAQKK